LPGAARIAEAGFTLQIREKRAIDDAQAASLPQLPDDWHGEALIL
jgi:hypothetical protein